MAIDQIGILRHPGVADGQQVYAGRCGRGLSYVDAETGVADGPTGRSPQPRLAEAVQAIVADYKIADQIRANVPEPVSAIIVKRSLPGAVRCQQIPATCKEGMRELIDEYASAQVVILVDVPIRPDRELVVVLGGSAAGHIHQPQRVVSVRKDAFK